MPCKLLIRISYCSVYELEIQILFAQDLGLIEKCELDTEKKTTKKSKKC